MVAAVNEGLEQKLFGLEPSENGVLIDDGYLYRFDLDGLRVVVGVRPAGWDELKFAPP